MSQHKSFRIEKYKKQRTVKTRRERIEALIKKGIDIKSVYNLPKEKIFKFKFKKEKELEEKKEEVKEFEYKEPIHRKTSKDIGKIK